MRTWARVAQGDTPPAVLSGLVAESIGNQTIRQHLSVSAGGRALRFRFSNEYSDKPLSIGGASVGMVAEGTVEADKTYPVTFNGRPSVAIPAGAFVLSDAIELRVRPLQELQVNLFFPETTAIFDGSAMSVLQDISVSAAGDFTKSTRMPMVERSASRRILTGVDVLSPERGKVVVALGDSITAGNAVDIGWPSYLARRVNGSIAVVNAGIGGNQLLRNGFGDGALVRFGRDVLAVPGVTHVVVLVGINDIGLPGVSIVGGGDWIPLSALPTLDAMILAYTQLAARAHDVGLKIYIGMLTPFQGAPAGYHSPQKEALRQAVNRWIRTSGVFDAIVDFEAALQSPSARESMSPHYDAGDHLHPNSEGQKALADSVDLSLFE